jgi:hypothetical protein
MSSDERFKWALEYGIGPTQYAKTKKKAKTDEDDKAVARKKLRTWCSDKQHVAAMANKRAQQRVAEEIYVDTGVDVWANDGRKLIRTLQWDSEAERAEIRQLIINNAPTLPATHMLQVVCTDGVSVHLTYGIAGAVKARGKKKGADNDDEAVDKANDLPTSQTPIDKLDKDRPGKYKDNLRPTRPLLERAYIMSDPGVRENTMVATPAVLLEQLQNAARGEPISEDFLKADDAAKVRGNRQHAAAVFETIARSAQHRKAELYAIEKVNRVLQRAVHPTTVKALQGRLRKLNQVMTLRQLEETISARASVAPALLFAYFRPEFRQGRRDRTLATKRFAEQIARSVLDMAQPVEPRVYMRDDGTKLPPQYYPEKRTVIGPFSEKTRMFQSGKHWHPARSGRKKLDRDLIMVNGNWGRPSGNSGMSRAAGSFPRVELQTRVERSLTHRAKHKQGLDTFYTCKLDEYRSSKQDGHLRVLLNGQRTDKTTPKAGTKAYTTDKKGNLVEFTIYQKKFKQKQSIGHDGLVHVTGRDEPAAEPFAARVVFDDEKQPQPASISRAYDKTQGGAIKRSQPGGQGPSARAGAC